MIVCHCKAVSDREIRRAARMGANSTSEVERYCGAGTDCGGCRPAVATVLRVEQLKLRRAARTAGTPA